MVGDYPEKNFGFHKIASVGFKPCGIRHISKNDVWELVWSSSLLQKITDIFLKPRKELEYYCPVCNERFATELEQLTHYDNEHGITENEN